MEFFRDFLGILRPFFLSYMGWVVAFERQTEERESVRFGSSMFMRQWGTRSSVQTSGLENDRIRTFGLVKLDSSIVWLRVWARQFKILRRQMSFCHVRVLLIKGQKKKKNNDRIMNFGYEGHILIDMVYCREWCDD